MKTTKISLNDLFQEESVSRATILDLIDKQINNCKLKYLQEWTRDHNACPKAKDERIKALMTKREEYEAIFFNQDLDNVLIDVNFSIEIKPKTKIAV